MPAHLKRFLQPVQLVQRLGLIREEADEAGLPEGYEPLLVPDDGMLRPAELVEDELILAVPVVPAMPGTEAMEQRLAGAGRRNGTSQPVRGAGAAEGRNDGPHPSAASRRRTKSN